MQNIFLAYIDSYSAVDGHYYVRIPDMGLSSPPIVAYMVSPGGAGGVVSVPQYAKDSEVVLAYLSGRYFILGFPQSAGPIAHNSYFPVRPAEEGETIIRDAKGRQFGFNKDGSFFVYLTRFANFVLNPIVKKLTAWISNIRVNTPAGSFEYEFDPQSKTSQARMYIFKTTDESTSNPTKKPEDRMFVKMGDLKDNTHMLEGYIKQDHSLATKQPAYKTEFKVGQQSDNTWLDVSTSIGEINPVKYSIKSDTKGITDIAVNDGSSSSTKFNIDAAGSVELIVSKGSDETSIKADASSGVEITVNKDKAVITVDKNGDVTFKLTDAAKLYLGGKSKALQLVTKKWVEMIFKNHMHPTAAPGAPSPPIPIPEPPVVGDSLTNVYTYTTLGE